MSGSLEQIDRGSLTVRKVSASTPVINFNQLKDLLVSKDFSRQEEYQKLISGELKFLDGKSDMKG